MALFSKEKDMFLKLVNSILILGLIFSVVIAIATGIKTINKEDVGDYKRYSKEVCMLDELEYECADDSCKKEVDKERKATCNKYYVKDKKEAERLNKINRDNFLISLSTAIILSLFIKILNKKKIYS